MIADKHSQISHVDYMHKALDLARKSPPRSTNYRVGALLIDADKNTVISMGYTLECEGNTHAEQCCFIKLGKFYGVPEELLENVMPENTLLYTTLEPCSRRLSGTLSCVDRILRLQNKIKAVYVGMLEPSTFVEENSGRGKLESAGIQVIFVSGLEREISDVATAGHRSQEAIDVTLA